MDPTTKREIMRLRAAGESWRCIATSLNRRGIPTSTGRGEWHASTVLRGIDSTNWNSYMRDYRKRTYLDD